MTLKALFPKELRLRLRVMQRNFIDLLSGDSKQIASSTDFDTQFPYSIELTQPIKNSAHFENKIDNIRKGIQQINGLIVKPDEIFSFWSLVSQPSQRNGYKVGRNIISGELKEDFGGGLCQLASIIYHVSLIAGLKVKERHNHSVDIYEEVDRFTPLGADASVVFGYKDLRILNNSGQTIKFDLRIADGNLIVTLSSATEILRKNIEFNRLTTEYKIEVETKIIQNPEEEGLILNKAIYLKSKTFKHQNL
jgi:vancomycin resistance protein VanW